MVTRGRPSKYKEEYCEQAYKLCLLGATDTELADFFQVTESTLNLWKKNHKEFSESLKRGKVVADAEVANKLYNRALGYKYEEIKQDSKDTTVTIKEMPADPTSAIFWLKNRQRNKWSDRKEVDVNISKLEDLLEDE